MCSKWSVSICEGGALWMWTIPAVRGVQEGPIKGSTADMEDSRTLTNQSGLQIGLLTMIVKISTGLEAVLVGTNITPDSTSKKTQAHYARPPKRRFRVTWKTRRGKTQSKPGRGATAAEPRVAGVEASM
ncbi:uncharacterized protein LOC143844664 isoform X2 [Paroedura picta]|uniref:uncharacterized protein LOC143844664 isoform X2 n=1 Tax=Paroedura picta TaxID=143630 RepID=UPI0040570E82